MYNIENWPFKWFGYWKEYGFNYYNYPSIQNFIKPQINKTYDKDKLLYYLDSGIEIASTSKSSFPSPIDGNIEIGSLSLRTDGEWLWLENISDLIKSFDVVIPIAFYENIQKNRFRIPRVTEKQKKKLEYPLF